MKKINTEMAWNEPKDGKNSEDDRNRSPKNESGPPDLEEIFGKMGKVFGGARKRGPRGGGYGKIVAILLLVLLGIWLLSGIYMVDAGQRGVELFLGKHSNTKGPGLTWRFPYPLGAHKIVDVESVHSKKITGTRAGEGALMLTKDEAIASVSLEVQYRISADAPEKYWFASLSPDKSVQDVVESATRERVGQTILDNVLTKDRKKLTEDVKALAQSVLDRYETGIKIVNINLEDAQPPEPVQEAFEEAIRAREHQQKRINIAQKEAQIIIAEVEGEAIREVTQAEAYRDTKIAEARGEAGRFERVALAFSKAPEVTRERLYLETMEEIFENTSKIIMGADSGNNLMVLPLEQLLKANKDEVKTQDNNKASSKTNNSSSNAKSRLNDIIVEPLGSTNSRVNTKRPESQRQTVPRRSGSVGY